MTDNVILETIRDFLERNVCSKIKLMKPFDDDITKYELTNPHAYIGWLPPPNQIPATNPPTIPEKAMPALIVGFDEGDDDGNDAGMNIRISAAVYNPGLYTQDGSFLPNHQGYQDLINLIFLCRQELAASPIIGDGKTETSKPFKWGMYLDTPIPYWYGWLTFRATAAVLPPITNVDKLMI